MRVSLALLALAVGGCVSIGTNYSEAAVTRLQPGMAKAEVVRLLGKPNTVVTIADGGEQLGWIYSQGSTFGARARSLTLPFGPDGRLQQVPGGPALQGPAAVASTSEVHLGTFSSDVQTIVHTGAPTPVVIGPLMPLPTGMQRIGADIWLKPVPTPSGKCIQAPPDYQGTGAANRPAITRALPRC